MWAFSLTQLYWPFPVTSSRYRRPRRPANKPRKISCLNEGNRSRGRTTGDMLKCQEAGNRQDMLSLWKSAHRRVTSSSLVGISLTFFYNKCTQTQHDMPSYTNKIYLCTVRSKRVLLSHPCMSWLNQFNVTEVLTFDSGNIIGKPADVHWLFWSAPFSTWRKNTSLTIHSLTHML